MPDIYNIGPAPTPPGGSGGVGYSIRGNAYASVGAGGGGPDSPTIATGGGTGRPATILNYVKITLEGTAGSLRRTEFQVTAYDAGTFDGLLSQFKVGTDVTVSWGRSGPGAGGGDSIQTTIYKQSFQSSKDGKWTLTCTGVGKGLEVLRSSAFGLPKGASENFYRLGKLFGVLPWQEKIPVTSLIDYMMVQSMKHMTSLNPLTLSAESGKGIPGQFVDYIAPSNVSQGTAPESTIGPKGRLVYFTFAYIMKFVNQSITEQGKKPINFANSSAVVDMGCGGKCPLISGDPLNILFPRGDGQSDYSVGGGQQDTASLIKNLLGKPTGIFTAAADVKFMAGPKHTIEDILISYDALKTIETNLSTNSSTDTSTDPSGTKMNLEGFFSALFSMISEASGTWCDLALLEDPSTDTGEAALYIINKKAKNASGGIGVYDDVSGEGGVRESSISGDVPSAWQQEAFAKGSVANNKAPSFSFSGWTSAKDALAKSGLDSAQAAGIKDTLRAAMNSLTPAEAKDKTDRPYPIGLGLKVNGVSGVKFGQALEMVSLQATRWADNTAFTVTKVEHTIQGQDWTTDITTVARLVP